MEDLNKQQLVLVSLLVSFVTSIATGVVTVALVEQAPPVVGETINRVVEKTIEKVTPAAVTENRAAAIPQIRIIKEEDLVVTAVELNTKSIVHVKASYSADPQIFVALGVIVSKDGYIVSPKANIEEGGEYSAELSDGTTYDLDLVARNDATNTAYFKVKQGKQKAGNATFNPVVFGSEESLKIGQSVVVIGGENRTIISKGTVTSLARDDTDSAKGRVHAIETDAGFVRYAVPLINLNGELIGVRTAPYEAGMPLSFVPVTLIKEQLQLIRTSENAPAKNVDVPQSKGPAKGELLPVPGIGQ